MNKKKYSQEPEEFISLARGSIHCRRCQAMSKRTRRQCRAPAVRKGGQVQRVCKAHGGLATGPRTTAGKQRSAAARTSHGRDTRRIREERSAKLREMLELETLGRSYGVISGPKTRGRKPGGKSSLSKGEEQEKCTNTGGNR